MASCNISAADAKTQALDLASASPWYAACAARLDWTTLLGDVQGGLVGANGEPTDCVDKDAWGITYATCQQYCSFTQMPSAARFSWGYFASEFNSYFLPWLALTAQLPYQTGGLRSDLVSGILSMGSPALITFSLGITISNRRWATQRFEALHERAKSHPGSNQEWVLHRIMNMKFLLEEAQQEPLAVNNRMELRAFIMQEEEAKRWTQIKKRLEITRRGLTASLFAQNAMAIVAWVITVLTSFIDGTATTQVAAGILWMWLIPVVCGWVAVGTQTRAQAIEEVLSEAFASRNGHDTPIAFGWSQTNTPVAEEPGRQTRHYFLLNRLLNTSGDVLRKGPLYNYARAATWWKLARAMEKYGTEMIDDLQRDELPEKPGQTVIIATARINTDDSQPHIYPRLLKFLTDDSWRLIWPILIALVVQFGITAGATIVAYETPPTGLGCNSGSYIIYGIGATIAMACMVTSTLLSHMVQFGRERPVENTNAVHIRALDIAAALMLSIGKLCAGLNCFWLIASTLFELAGLYNTCFCLSSMAGLGREGAYLLLWDANSYTAVRVGYWWTIGSSVAAGVWIFFIVLFVFLSAQGRLGRKWRRWMARKA